jgi:broad specificity phosphatase PhoE
MNIILARHGETEWSLNGRHTGLTDIELTENGILQGKRLGERLGGKKFSKVYSSPLKRAHKTCELAGYGEGVEITDLLLEWDYGEFEGIKTVEIRKTYPEWNVFKGPVPGGESIEQVSARADALIEKIRSLGSEADVLLFSSGHFSRVFGARWVGFPAEYGRCLTMSTASYSLLSYEHEYPVIKTWNDTSHL